VEWLRKRGNRVSSSRKLFGPSIRKHYFGFVLVILLVPMTKAHPVANITFTVLQDLTPCAVADKRKHFGGSAASIFMAEPLLNFHNYLPNRTAHTPKDRHLSVNNSIFTRFINCRKREVVWTPYDFSPKICAHKISTLYGTLHSGTSGIVQNLLVL